MELRHLRYFVTVAEELSFTRAAEKLRLAQPSLTRQIKNLESELRVQLFSRRTRRISLTEQGQFFLERTKRLLAQSALDVQDVRQCGMGGRAGSLNIGYTADLHYNLLPGALSRLRTIWPDVSFHLFDLTVSEQLRAFEKNQLDLSFAREFRPPPKTGLQSREIYDCEVMVVLPEDHALAHQSELTLAALKPLPFVVLSDDRYPGTHRWLAQTCRKAKFAPKIAHEVDRTPTLLSCVGLGLGIALLPESCRKMAHEGTVFRPLSEPVKSRTEIMWKKRTLSKPLLEYVDLIRKRLD